MSIYIHKSHNVNVLLYHLVFPTKFRRIVVDEKVDQIIRDTCDGIALRYDIHFVEIGTDKDHVHFLIQSIPMWNVTKIVTTVKSITARELFRKHPDLKRELWGGHLWTEGYFVATIGEGGNKNVIEVYIQKQGNNPKDLQLKLFDFNI